MSRHAIDHVGAREQLKAMYRRMTPEQQLKMSIALDRELLRVRLKKEGKV